MDNRAGEMEVFVNAAESGSFSAAGRRLGLSPSAVSKLVSRMEGRLGTRLLVRTTRALRLTPEGEAYLARAQRILADIEATEREVAGGARAAPRGKLRVNALIGVGMRCIVPILPDFLSRYPLVEIDLTLTDSVIDLIGERVDVAIRSGPMRDSTLKARRIMETRQIIVAAPDYLARHGTPLHPRELERHNCIGFNFRRSLDGWPFRDPADGRRWIQATHGTVLASNGTIVRQLCVDGVGLARVGQFLVQHDLDAGRLVEVLKPWNPEDMELIHAVFAGHEHLETRIRAFVDFLVETLPP